MCARSSTTYNILLHQGLSRQKLSCALVSSSIELNITDSLFPGDGRFPAAAVHLHRRFGPLACEDAAVGGGLFAHLIVHGLATAHTIHTGVHHTTAGRSTQQATGEN